MRSSIGDILSSRQPKEPREFSVIRDFIKQNYNINPQLQIRGKNIIIVVPDAATAGELRMRLHELQAACGNDKKLMIRIS